MPLEARRGLSERVGCVAEWVDRVGCVAEWVDRVGCVAEWVERVGCEIGLCCRVD